jgi:hypothetical protein
VDEVGDGVGLDVEAGLLIDGDDAACRGVEAGGQSGELAIELGDVGVLRQFAGGDDLRDENGDVRVDLAAGAHDGLGGGEDAGDGFFVVEMVVPGVEQDDVRGGLAEGVADDAGEEFDVLAAVALVGERAEPGLGFARAGVFDEVAGGGELFPERLAIDAEGVAARGDGVAGGHDTPHALRGCGGGGGKAVPEGQ